MSGACSVEIVREGEEGVDDGFLLSLFDRVSVIIEFESIVSDSLLR